MKANEEIRWDMIGIAGVTAAIVSVIAVKWLLKFIQTNTFTVFGIYRVVLASVLLALFFFVR
jgi:undecaprenyl-diphosphatase